MCIYPQWHPLLTKNNSDNPDRPVFLVGTKTDLRPCRGEEEDDEKEEQRDMDIAKRPYCSSSSPSSSSSSPPISPAQARRLAARLKSVVAYLECSALRDPASVDAVFGAVAAHVLARRVAAERDKIERSVLRRERMQSGIFGLFV